MDSRLIYNISVAKTPKVDWLNPTIDNGAWQYIGAEEEMNRAFVISQINTFIEGDVLCIQHTRNGSFETTKSNFPTAVADILGIYDFMVWDANFEKVIEFNKIGVMRCGIFNPHSSYH